ncbi:MAG: sigma-70 family RNA polymerase sigma factor [Anaerolineae bacterium]|nr:sigma-70 family RNA polymerase sigma factor [Anaerolineae bacterium]
MATTWNRAVSDTSTDADARLAESDLRATLDAYWSRVCRTLYNLLGDWDRAEDLALDVFYRLHQQPPEDMDVVGTWLYRVATHAGLNALRASKRRSRYEEAAGQLQLQREMPVSPDVELERRQEQARVRWVLALMRPRAAQLLYLRYLGLSYAELAEALNLTPGSIGKLLARAQKEFERRYRALEDSDGTDP